tara:strand:- start:1305 stop:1448 length:144 start_codon:yes stop_codon:yes gene_type:complete
MLFQCSKEKQGGLGVEDFRKQESLLCDVGNFSTQGNHSKMLGTLEQV